MVSLTWAETKSMVEDLEECATGGDAQDVSEIRGMEKRIAETCARRVFDAKAIIKAMTDQAVQRERQEVVPSEEAFASQVAELEQERASLVSRIEGGREVEAEAQAEIKRLQEEVRRADEAMENSVEAHLVEMPRVQNSISLYANVTDIRWNYDAEPGKLAGWLAPKGSDSVQGFQFVTTGRSDFEVANKLWDIIDGRARAMVEA